MDRGQRYCRQNVIFFSQYTRFFVIFNVKGEAAKQKKSTTFAFTHKIKLLTRVLRRALAQNTHSSDNNRVHAEGTKY